MSYSYISDLLVVTNLATTFTIKYNEAQTNPFSIHLDPNNRVLTLEIKLDCTFSDLQYSSEVRPLFLSDVRVSDRFKDGFVSSIYKETTLNNCKIVPNYLYSNYLINITILETQEHVGVYTRDNGIYIYLSLDMTNEEIIDVINTRSDAFYILDLDNCRDLLFNFINIQQKPLGTQAISESNSYYRPSQNQYVSRNSYLLHYIDQLKTNYPEINIVLNESDWDEDKKEHFLLDFDNLEESGSSDLKGPAVRHPKGYLTQFTNVTANFHYVCNGDRTTFENRRVDFIESNFLRTMTGGSLNHPDLGSLRYTSTPLNIVESELEVTFTINDSEISAYHFSFPVLFTYQTYRFKATYYTIDKIINSLTINNRDKIVSELPQLQRPEKGVI